MSPLHWQSFWRQDPQAGQKEGVLHTGEASWDRLFFQSSQKHLIGHSGEQSVKSRKAFGWKHHLLAEAESVILSCAATARLAGRQDIHALAPGEAPASP